MKITLKVFSGKKGAQIKRELFDIMSVRGFDYSKNPNNLSKSDLIIYHLDRLINEAFTDYKNGIYLPIVFDDFISRIDEAIDIVPYFKQIVSLGVPVYYFIDNPVSLDKLKNIADIVPIQFF